MAAISSQEAVKLYHLALADPTHHSGHNMFTFHLNWHLQNQDPIPPSHGPNANWGANLAFGTRFLQMHHEMVKAADDEPKSHMHHQSLVRWYSSRGFDLPDEWDPLSEIPSVHNYTPDLSIFPQTIRAAIINLAEQRNIMPEDFLRRASNQPGFALPKYFTRAGIGTGESPEPYTGAKKLADFQNVNQLGCCLVFPHNRWHMAIGGAMSSLATAIADPIFYFGVHWHIDKVYDEYKHILSESNIQPPAQPPISPTLDVESRTIGVAFTSEQIQQREVDIALSVALRETLPLTQ